MKPRRFRSVTKRQIAEEVTSLRHAANLLRYEIDELNIGTAKNRILDLEDRLRTLADHLRGELLLAK